MMKLNDVKKLAKQDSGGSLQQKLKKLLGFRQEPYPRENQLETPESEKIIKNRNGLKNIKRKSNRKLNRCTADNHDMSKIF